MKKIIILLIAFLSLIVSCKSTKGLTMPIKAENLDSNVFVVTRVVVKSDTIEPSDEELIEIFQLLPYAEICDLVMEKRDFSLIFLLFRLQKLQTILNTP